MKFKTLDLRLLKAIRTSQKSVPLENVSRRTSLSKSQHLLERMNLRCPFLFPTQKRHEAIPTWLLLTWSLGCTGFLLPSSPPSISMALLLMTSFTFMFVWVPDPVCHTTRGKWSFNFPSATCRTEVTEGIAYSKNGDTHRAIVLSYE